MGSNPACSRWPRDGWTLRTPKRAKQGAGARCVISPSVWERSAPDAVRSFAEVAGFLYRDEDEVRQKSKALGLKTGPRHGERLRAVPNVERLDEQRAHDLKNRGARSRGSRHRRTMAAPSTAGFQTSEMNTEA
jgi:hypothetical protein